MFKDSIILSRRCTLCTTDPDLNCLICAMLHDSLNHTFKKVHDFLSYHVYEKNKRISLQYLNLLK